MGSTALHDLAGVIHVHSLYSDGTGTVPEIAAAAEANDLDFVLLTDHDTLRGQDQRRRGLARLRPGARGRGGVARRGGHYLAFGIDRVIDHKGLDGHAIIERVNEAGGFGFLSHPFSQGSERFNRAPMSWAAMDATGYTGLELWSFVTDSAEKINRHQRPVPLHPHAGPVRRQAAAVNLETWDRLCAARRCVASRRHRRASGRDPDRRPRAAAADGLQALVPLPAHAPACRARPRRDSSTETAISSTERCAPGTPTSRWTRSPPRAAFGSRRRARSA